MGHLQIEDSGDGLLILRVAANILIMQSRTDDRELGEWVNNPHPKKSPCSDLPRFWKLPLERFQQKKIGVRFATWNESSGSHQLLQGT
jgi:hypothetical protein